MAWGQWDKAGAYAWGFEYDGVQIDSIQEVTGLKMENDVIEIKHNTPDGKYINVKVPGREKNGELTLTRGLTQDQSFDKWMKEVRLGQITTARKSGSLIMYDYSGQEVKRYTVTNCWPKSLELGTLKAGDTNILTEKLTLAHEGIQPA